MADPTLQPVVVFTQPALATSAPAVVQGCVNRQAAADYMRAVGFESRVKGFTIGLVVGAAACIALTLYVKSKGG